MVSATGLIKEYRLLSPEEEAEAWARGDKNAVVEGVMPLILAKIKAAVGSEQSRDYDEYLSEAHLSVAHALRTFDPSRSRFSTYALKLLPHKLWHLKKKLAKRRRVRVYGEAGYVGAAKKCRELELVDETELYPEAKRLVGKVCTVRERMVLERRIAGETYDAIAQDFNVTRERIRQIYSVALTKVRTKLETVSHLRSLPSTP